MSGKVERRYNQRFSQMCLDQILANPQHMLSFLVNRRRRKWNATQHGSEGPSVQVGHAESRHAGGPERLFLEDADFNQMSNWCGERQGAVFGKPCVLIGGIPVDHRTAKMWESVGELPKGTVARSLTNGGWTPN